MELSECHLMIINFCYLLKKNAVHAQILSWKVDERVKKHSFISNTTMNYYLNFVLENNLYIYKWTDKFVEIYSQ